MDIIAKLRELSDSDPALKQQLINYEKFCGEVKQLKQQYSQTNAPETLADGIRLLSENVAYHPFAHLLILLGDAYITEGDFEAGIACMKSAAANFPDIYHYPLFYLRMAQYHMEKSETEIGLDYLIRLCTEIKDYKAYIVLHDMIEIWEKYKHLVADRLPEVNVDEVLVTTTVLSSAQIMTPDKCSQTIDQIFSPPHTTLLADLSSHLDEMTANGTLLNYLNKWERAFYYADEICTEVNSGGFEHYLYYHGTHFVKACQVFAQIGAQQMLCIAEQIKNKFPHGRIPKSALSIQNAMDRLEEMGIDFEEEDEIYYSSAEKELLDRLTAYVLENQKHFR